MPLRPWRVVVPALLALLLLAAAWVGWLAWHVNRDLSAAVGDARDLQAALEAGDDARTDTALAALREHSGAAADRTDGVTWSLLTHLPAYGDDAAGVRTVAGVVHDLSTDGLEPLVETSRTIDGLLPRDGRIDLAAVEALQAPVAQGHEALERARADLAAQPSTGFVAGLRDKYRELQGQVNDAADALASADTAVRLLPSMLGQGGARHYLLVFQNNAELRATGGLPGSVSYVTADDGALSLERQVAGNSFGKTATTVLPLTTSERKLYGTYLGRYFLDANFQPDFARASDLWRARWLQVFPDQPVDGVISLDPVALSYLLPALGGVQVGQTTLTTDNAVDTLLNGVYLTYPDPADQDAFFQRAAAAVFTRLTGGVESPQDLVRGLARGAEEGRVYVHSFDEGEQRQLASSIVAGGVITETSDRPDLLVTLNDTTGAKMSYYLRSSVEVDATYCTGGVQGFSGHLRLHSDAPADAGSTLPDYVLGPALGFPKGSQIVTVRLYSPIGGEISDLQFNSRTTGLDVIDDGGRQVARTYAQLKPGQTVDITWRATSGPDQTRAATVWSTPTLDSKPARMTLASSCD